MLPEREFSSSDSRLRYDRKESIYGSSSLVINTQAAMISALIFGDIYQLKSFFGGKGIMNVVICGLFSALFRFLFFLALKNSFFLFFFSHPDLVSGMFLFYLPFFLPSVILLPSCLRALLVPSSFGT